MATQQGLTQSGETALAQKAADGATHHAIQNLGADLPCLQDDGLLFGPGQARRASGAILCPAIMFCQYTHGFLRFDKYARTPRAVAATRVVKRSIALLGR
jgi:hypothetical protein